MERHKEVNDELGENNVNMILEEVENGIIEKMNVKQIALLMHPKVHGVYKEKKDKHSLVDVVKEMLDCWYNYKLCDPDIDSREELIKILEFDEICLQALAQRLRFGE